MVKKPRYRHPLLDLGGFVLDRTKVARCFRKTTENIEVIQHALTFSGLNETIRLVHLTDFHASRSVRFAFLQRAVEQALDLNPDLVCLTGDYTTCGLSDWRPLTRLFQSLTERVPTFAVLGNHDGLPAESHPIYSNTVNSLRAANVQILENRHAVLSKGASQLQIVGTGDLLTGPFKPADAFAHCEAHLPTVLLTHNPDARQLVLPFKWNLCLCGHTHGGQINIPGLSGLFTPILDRAYQSGIFPQGERFLHVNRGIGSIGGVRFRARPEVCLFELSGPKR